MLIFNLKITFCHFFRDLLVVELIYDDIISNYKFFEYIFGL